MPRITGKLGTLSIAGTPIADLHNWTLDFTVEALPCAIKGEKFNTVAVGGLDVRITAERFVQDSGGSTLATQAVGQMATVPASTEVAYVLDQLSGTGGASISGNGVVTRGGLTSPRSLAGDTIEIVGTSIPVVS